MADPIQSSSSIPLPVYQTLQPLAPPKPPSNEVTEAETQANNAETKRANDSSDFSSYLNKASILQVKQNTPTVHYDPVADLQNSSVYQLPGSTSPL